MFQKTCIHMMIQDNFIKSPIPRQGLFFIPAVLVLPLFWEIGGVESSQMVSDIFAFFFAIPFTLIFFKDLRKKQALIDEENAKGEGQVCNEMDFNPDPAQNSKADM